MKNINRWLLGGVALLLIGFGLSKVGTGIDAGEKIAGVKKSIVQQKELIQEKTNNALEKTTQKENVGPEIVVIGGVEGAAFQGGKRVQSGKDFQESLDNIVAAFYGDDSVNSGGYKDPYIRKVVLLVNETETLMLGGAGLEMVFATEGELIEKDNDIVMQAGSQYVVSNNTRDVVKYTKTDGSIIFSVSQGDSVVVELLRRKSLIGGEILFGDHVMGGVSFSNTGGLDTKQVSLNPVTVYPGKKYTVELSHNDDPLETLGLYGLTKSSTLSDKDKSDFELDKSGDEISDAQKNIFKDSDVKTGGMKNRSNAISIQSVSQKTMNLEVTIPPENGTYYVMLQDSGGYTYGLPLYVTDDMKLKIEDYPDQVQFTIRHKYPIDQGVLEESLSEVLGAGKYQIDMSSSITNITYYLGPDEKVTGTLSIKNIFGETNSLPVDISQKEIPKAFRQTLVQGGALNTLPKLGYRGDKIEVTHKNNSVFSLQFQECDLTEPDFYAKKGRSFDSYLFACDGESIKRDYDFSSESEWRKTYDKEIELPTELKKSDYFRVWLDDEEGAKYFVRSSVGLYAKVTDENIYLWAFDFDTGEFVRSGGVRMLTKDMKDIASYPYQRKYDLPELPEQDDGIMVVAFESDKGDTSLLTLSTRRNGWFYFSDYEKRVYKSMEIQSYLDTYDLYKQRGRRGWQGDADPLKIYGYTDRALYRAGDDIFYSGFVRDILNEELPTGSVVVKLSDADGSEISRKEISDLDEFGGFNGSFTLDDEVDLGFWYIDFTYDEDTYFSQSLKVEEFQKPTFYIDTRVDSVGDDIVGTIAPTYYFGSPLGSYDLEIDWNLQESYVNHWSWRGNDENEDPYYYNYRFDTDYLSGGNLSLVDQTQSPVSVTLTELSTIQSQGVSLTLGGSIRVIDKLSDELQTYNFTETIEPKAKIGLSGYPYERVYEKNKETLKITGEVESSPQSSKTYYQRYFKSYENNFERGVDRNWYHANGRKYKSIGKKNEIGGSSFELVPPLDEPGDYLLRARVESNDIVVGEVQKEVNYYDRSYWDTQTSMGRVTNNYELAVNIPQKSHVMGENIEINIEPYIKGATALITVERGNDIIDIQELLLDGSQITLPVKSTYVPNVNIGVVLMVGEKSDLGGGKRTEPRFFVGYGEAQIDKNEVTLNIVVETDKETYSPGERATLTIKTTDSTGNPIDARLSIGVVDKALADLYDLIKEPIPYFYNTVGSYIGNFTNLRLLYQSLKVFTANGAKGGGGEGGFADFALRDSFEDLAYWRGAIVTENGEAIVSTKLPDNLTSWMIDIIGISKDNKLGTVRKEFTVSKPLIIQPNLPTFLTLGDSIQMPIKVLVTGDSIRNDLPILVSGELETQDGRIVKLGNIETTPNTKTLFEIEVPNTVWGDEEIIVRFKAESRNGSDGFERTIPLRTDGFISYDFLFSGASIGEHLFDLGGPSSFADLNVSVSRFPIEALSKAFEYLLRYPYGCTEQLMSSLFPIATVLELSSEGLLGDAFVRGDKIVLSNKSPQPIEDLLQSGFDKIFRHQQPNGGMAYWAQGESIYPLSAYVYGAMSLYDSKGYKTHKQNITELATYLEKYGGADNAREYLYYLWNKSLSNDVDPEEITELITDSSDLTSRVLAFATLSRIGAIEQAQALNSGIDLSGRLPTPKYGEYFDKTTIYSIWMRGAIYLAQNEAVQSESIERSIQGVVIKLLESRDSQGRWSWSTQANVNALLGLGEYLKRKKGEETSLSCTLKINGKTQTVILESGEYSKDYLFSDETVDSVKLGWSCDDDVLLDASMKYLLENYTEIAPAYNGVEKLSLKLNDTDVNVGQEVILEGTFKVSEKAKQVAVEFFIPSTMKLLGTIQGGGSTRGNDRQGWRGGTSVQSLSKTFTVVGTNRRGGCWPDHAEVRFDRLFLYYDELKPSGESTCNFEIKALKAYEGEVNTMPSRLWEMYQTNVWGRSNVE